MQRRKAVRFLTLPMLPLSRGRGGKLSEELEKIGETEKLLLERLNGLSFSSKDSFLLSFSKLWKKRSFEHHVRERVEIK